MATTSNSNQKRRGGVVGHIFAAIGKVIGTILLIGIITSAILACFAATYIKTVILPDAHLDLTSYDTALSSTIYYMDKTTGQPVELQTLHGTENRVWVTYDQIPQNLVNATIAIEDHRFREHNGVDWIRTAKGFLTMLTGKDIQGGSTITQQLIKNMTGEKDVTVKRKIQEIFRALELDKNYSKDVILEYYLNYIYLGKRCYGVSTAANTYFNKDVSDLDLAECAVLISITNNPSIYNPYLYPDNNKTRATRVLNKMLEQNMISQREYDEAKARLSDVSAMLASGDEGAEAQPTVVYPWYVEEVISDVTEDLMEQYDLSKKAAGDKLYLGGLSVYTCLDPDIQAIVDSVYRTKESMPLVSASGQSLQSAIVVINPEGEVVALSGAMGEKTRSRGFNMARDAHRQPGSSIKMISTYAPALDMGLITPYSAFDDSPVMEVGGKAWPSNAYLRYYGRMTVFDAVEESANTVAARVLQLVTPEASFQFLEERFGISDKSLVASGDRNDLGLSQLALGGLTNGVSPLEIAAAYSAFPRGGTYIPPRTYTTVVDNEGHIILDHTADQQVTAVKGTTAWYVNNMLKNVITGARGTGREAALSNMTVAGKTGSTNSNNDKWFVGYTPYYTAAVWTGYETPERIKTNGGYNPAVRLWKQVMSQVHEGLESKDFPQPDGLVQASYCMDSGMIPTDACQLDPRGSRVATGYFFPEDKPSQYCDVHETVEVCTASPVTNADGEAVGSLYHAAGEFCPREAIPDTDILDTVKTIALLKVDRNRVGGRVAQDEGYMLDTWQSYGSCTVHTGPITIPSKEYDPATFDFNDPTTWPTDAQWPGFNAEDPSTWPVVTPPPVTTPEAGNQPGGDEPQVTPTSEPSYTPAPTPTPVETPPPTVAPPEPPDGDIEPVAPPENFGF